MRILKNIIFIFAFILFFFANLLAVEPVVESVVGKKKYLDGEIIVKFKNTALSNNSGYSAKMQKMTIDKIDVDKFKEKYTGKYNIKNLEKNFSNSENQPPLKATTKYTTGSTSQKKSIEGMNLIYKIKYDSQDDAKKVAQELADDPDVEWAQPSYIYYPLTTIPNDPCFNNSGVSTGYGKRQWSLSGIDDYGYATPNIDVKRAWDITTGKSDVVIAIVDTGVQLTHEDIKNRLWINIGEIAGNGIDDDENGKIDDINGWDFGDNDNNPNLTSYTNQIHGSVVASICSAQGNNAIGVSGVAWDSRVMVIKCSSQTFSGLINVDKAIEYAVDNNAKIINMSFGSKDEDSALKTAIEYAYANNIIMFVAGGNENASDVLYPAKYPEVICVGATDDEDKKSSYSNYNERVDISAPGDFIASIQPSSTNDNLYYSQYYAMSGTSMATPMAVGVASLVCSRKPDITPSEMKTILKETADPIDDKNPSYAGKIGSGRINAYNALIKCGAVFNYLYDGLGDSDISISTNSDVISANWSFLGATTYYYEISANPNLSITSFSKSTNNNFVTELITSGLTNKTTYYVYIQAETKYGDKSQIYRTNGVYINFESTEEKINYNNDTTVRTNSGVEVIIPSATFSEDVNLIIEKRSANFEVIKKANDNISNQTSKYFAENSGLFFYFQAMSIANGTNLKNFNKNITIKMPYQDDNNDKIVDGTNVEVKNLAIFYLDENTSEWIQLKNVWYDYENKTVNALTDHFSIYSVLKTSVEKTVSEIIIYPNPCKINDVKYLSIGNLPNDAENLSIKIYDITGKLMNELNQNNITRNVAGTSFTWDGKTKENLTVASGIYLFLIKYNGDKKIEKVAILR